ncbi:uncharacterized protein EV154DRAFT_492476 [Mucor mucedo]|uniref:Uncharacterized protein n=1 Tax=Mucor saturninus TaxID=64648 RepID=A0A8H7QKU8_9FUNG|nr:uncharacterized protein EV154DRAFT_492476 [Mucor mucedo]KAG2194504.1 hypothetical protein INT47_005777 [Mucor saturninus]KAI7896495.1 hypothetical protein EV154DRAFT_492476 [Mucor mucedo]
MKYLTFTFITLISCAIALPITTSTEPITAVEEKEILVQHDILDEVFPVQVDTLAQLIATHLQFDHLDAVISRTDKEIATEFQHHIQINVEANEFDDELVSHNANQHTIQQQSPTLDMMDLEILKSQIFAAIQAHTEGNLPLTWDKLADKLSRQAIESYLRTSLLETCGGQHEVEDVILSSCLNENAIQLATNLDSYLTSSLEYVFEALDQHALPDLLQHTAQDLKGILKYFNSAFLQNGNRKFILEVVPWNSDPTDIHNFKSRLLEMAVHPSLVDNEDVHSIAFFVEYAAMARL